MPTLSSPMVEVRLTEEQKCFVPDWSEQVSDFQGRYDKEMEDVEERFRLVLHEGSHAVEYHRQFRANVKNHGPSVCFRDGELHYTLGQVTRTTRRYYVPSRLQRAMVCIAGFYLVEHFTGVAEDEWVIECDLQWMRRFLSLSKDADVSEIVLLAKGKLNDELSDPTFIPQLKQACINYEQDVFGDMSATEWGWRTYIDLKMAAAEIFGP